MQDNMMKRFALKSDAKLAEMLADGDITDADMVEIAAIRVNLQAELLAQDTAKWSTGDMATGLADTVRVASKVTVRIARKLTFDGKAWSSDDRMSREDSDAETAKLIVKLNTDYATAPKGAIIRVDSDGAISTSHEAAVPGAGKGGGKGTRMVIDGTEYADAAAAIAALGIDGKYENANKSVAAWVAKEQSRMVRFYPTSQTNEMKDVRNFAGGNRITVELPDGTILQAA
jgi:hypothetical protein